MFVLKKIDKRPEIIDKIQNPLIYLVIRYLVSRFLSLVNRIGRWDLNEGVLCMLTVKHHSMKKPLVFLLLFVATPGLSQITGKVTARSGQPVAFANVMLYRLADSVMVAGTGADENGNFSIPIPSPGQYYAGFRSVGFKTLLSGELLLQETAYRMDEVIMEEEAGLLDEAVVRAKKDFVRDTPFGKVVDVKASMMTAGSTALQLLERLPGVVIDGRNNTISLNGQNGVSVMINGRLVRLSLPELMTMLTNMSGDQIARIELLTSPSAAADSEGGAMINIVLDKGAEDGTRLQYSATGGYGWREKAATSLNLSHVKGPLRLNAAYAYLHDGRKTSWHAQGSHNVPVLGGFNYHNFYSQTASLRNSHNFNLGLDRRLGSKTLIGGDLSLSRSGNKVDVFNDGTYDFPAGDFIRLLLKSQGKNVWKSLQSGIFIEQQLSEGEGINVDGGFLYFRNSSPALITSDYYDREGNEIQPAGEAFTHGNKGWSLSGIRIALLKADYHRQVFRKVKLEAGVKGSWSENVNESGVQRLDDGQWIPDPRFGGATSGRERIGAAYVSINTVIREGNQLTTGLRYEFWERIFTGQVGSGRLSQLFPSIHWSLKFSGNASLQTSLVRRISRPDYNDLVSNMFYNDPGSVFTGNPLLKPGITTAFQTDYSFKRLTLGLFLRHEENPIIRYQLTADANNEIYVQSPQNLVFQRSSGLSYSLSLQPFQWWKMDLGGSYAIRNYKITYTPRPFENRYFFQNYYLNQRFSLTHGIEAELSGWYMHKSFEGARSVDGFGVVNFGISKKLGKAGGTLQFSVPDVFGGLHTFSYFGKATAMAFNNTAKVEYKDEAAIARVFKLTYSRTFGSQQADRQRKTAAEEERTRVRD